jgi:hypothetical protein
MATSYISKIYKCKDGTAQFSEEYFECIQDRKRLNALKNHYLASTKQRIPLSYGYVLILSETIKTRFLNKEEKALLKSLIESEGIDYLKPRFRKKSQLLGKSEQPDMFPHLYEFRFPSVDYRDLNRFNVPSDR